MKFPILWFCLFHFGHINPFYIQSYDLFICFCKYSLSFTDILTTCFSFISLFFFYSVLFPTKIFNFFWKFSISFFSNCALGVLNKKSLVHILQFYFVHLNL